MPPFQKSQLDIVTAANALTIYDAINGVELSIDDVAKKILDTYPNKKFMVFTHAVDNEGVHRVDVREIGHYSPVSVGGYFDVRYVTYSPLIANNLAHALQCALIENNINF